MKIHLSAKDSTKLGLMKRENIARQRHAPNAAQRGYPVVPPLTLAAATHPPDPIAAALNVGLSARPASVDAGR
jgi:hypothetical protein